MLSDVEKRVSNGLRSGQVIDFIILHHDFGSCAPHIPPAGSQQYNWKVIDGRIINGQLKGQVFGKMVDKGQGLWMSRQADLEKELGPLFRDRKPLLSSR